MIYWYGAFGKGDAFDIPIPISGTLARGTGKFREVLREFILADSFGDWL